MGVNNFDFSQQNPRLDRKLKRIEKRANETDKLLKMVEQTCGQNHCNCPGASKIKEQLKFLKSLPE